MDARQDPAAVADLAPNQRDVHGPVAQLERSGHELPGGRGERDPGRLPRSVIGSTIVDRHVKRVPDPASGETVCSFCLSGRPGSCPISSRHTSRKPGASEPTTGPGRRRWWIGSLGPPGRRAVISWSTSDAGSGGRPGGWRGATCRRSISNNPITRRSRPYNWGMRSPAAGAPAARS